VKLVEESVVAVLVSLLKPKLVPPKYVLLRSAPVKLDPLKSLLPKPLLLILTLERLESVRERLRNVMPVKSALAKLALWPIPPRCAFVRLALLKSAPVRLASVIVAPVRSTEEKSRYLKSTVARSAFVILETKVAFGGVCVQLSVVSRPLQLALALSIILSVPPVFSLQP